MLARTRRYTHFIARTAVLAVAAAAFVVVSGLPAQAHAFYAAPPYYGSSCQTFSFGPLGYSTCSPSNIYYAHPSYDYSAYPYYYYAARGGSVVDEGAPGEGGNGHP